MIDTLTLKMQAAHGYIVSPDPLIVGASLDYTPRGYSSFKVKSAVVCWVKPILFSQGPYSFSTPTDPTPSAGATTSFYEMAANEIVEFGLQLPFGGNVDNNGSVHGDRIQFLAIYSANAGDLVINAH